MTYLLTFSCYGTHLHGEPGGRVNRWHNRYGSQWLEERPGLARAERGLMDQLPYLLDERRRGIVLQAIVSRAAERGWLLLAVHVRSTHVHLVVDAGVEPGRVLNDLKAFASRGLNRAGVDVEGRKRWARHGSTRYLWNAESVTAAVRYVVVQQGEAMAVFGG